MMETTIFAYENLYYELWETARRYRAIAQFRVIGNSHDERMIPMIEVGQGDQVIFLCQRAERNGAAYAVLSSSHGKGILSGMGMRMGAGRAL